MTEQEIQQLLAKQEALITGQAQIITALSALTHQTEQLVAGLKQESDRTRQETRAVVVTLAALKDEITSLAGNIGAITHTQASYTSTLQQISGEQQALVQEMRHIAEPTGQTIANLEQVMRGVWGAANQTVLMLGTLPTRMQANLDSILQAHTAAAQTMQQASQALAAAAERLKKTLP
jgi:chromosome segregation ATPase